MKAYCIECECDDAFYGWYVDRIYLSREHAEHDMKLLANINKGINYRINEWFIYDTTDKDLQ